MGEVMQMPERESLTALVAGEARAEMARRKISITGLSGLTGRPFGHWQRRLAGAVSMDVEDLADLARVLGCGPGDLLPRGVADGGPAPWAPSGSNRRPTD